VEDVEGCAAVAVALLAGDEEKLVDVLPALSQGFGGEGVDIMLQDIELFGR